ncbi:MAG: DUF4845 domain-containing protein [Gammaproteobacteria bacterium]|nr:DUF4845 domain-containing protein [Gammaproteobacteria bacterium]
MNIDKQQGMSMWVLLAMAVLGGFFTLLAVKLFPVYMTDMNVDSALNRLAKEASSAEMTNSGIRESLEKRFMIDDIDRHVDLRKALSFEPQGGKRIVRISYDSITPVFGNVFVLIEFDHSAEIGRFVGE